MNAALDTGLEILALTLVVLGTLLFTAGTVGVVRFPDIPNRLHALTKADNLGLGLVLAGVALLLGSWGSALVLLLVWLLALVAASVSARVMAEVASQGESGRRAGDR